MERLSKIGILFLIIFAMGITGLVVDSCQSENKELTIEKKDTDSYLEALQANLRTFMKADIVTGSGSRGRIPELPDTGKNGFQTVLVDFDAKPGLEVLDSVRTPEDMLDLCQKYGAQFSMVDDGMMDDSIQISVEAAEAALTPLADASREFLRQHGLTDAEMDGILVELNLDNSCFIVLSMALCVAEEEQTMSELTWRVNPFALTANAASAGDMAWNCAMHASGITDILALVRDEVAFRLTKYAVTKVLRLALPRMFGWVSAAVMIVKYADCLAHYNRYF